MKLIKLALILSTLIFSNCYAQAVNINQATAAEISKSLNGVGIKKAELIVSYRKEHGDFKTLEELLGVKGIGQKILLQNKENIRLK